MDVPINSEGNEQYQQQGWPLMSRNRGTHQHSLSSISNSYASPEALSREASADKRSSVDVSSTYQLFNGSSAGGMVGPSLSIEKVVVF